jgi:hypothetical protein
MSKPINPWKVTGYKAGQNVVCKIIAAEEGGYAVHVPKDNLAGFIQTNATHRPGEEILAQFVCVHKSRLLLSPLMSASLNKGNPLARQSTVNWQEQLDEMEPGSQSAPASQNEIYQPPGNQTASYAPPAQSYAPPAQSYAAPVQNYQAQPQFDVASPAQWEDAVAKNRTPTKRFRLRRAIDLIMPPVEEEGLSNLMTINMAEYDLEWLTTDIEGGMRTGCIKITSEDKLSRAAALLYRGRAVGCIYGCKADPEQHPTEEALSRLVGDLNASDCVVTLYDLPEPVTLAMSALFLGCDVEADDSMTSRNYFDFVMNWFVQNKRTACVAVTLSDLSNYLILVHHGRFIGAFFVNEQQFTSDINLINNLFVEDPNAVVKASLLSDELFTPGTRIGYSFSMARKKN